MPNGVYYGSRGVAIWADFELFEIVGGAGDINISISMPNYCDEPYGDLVMYITKVLSAWTEVWGTACCSKAAKSSIFCCVLLRCFVIEPSAALHGRMTSMPNEISYYITATTHKTRLHIVEYDTEWLWF